MPVGLIASESETGMALVGWGILDFDLSAWLKGTVEVVVDPDGYITTRGRLDDESKGKVLDWIPDPKEK